MTTVKHPFIRKLSVNVPTAEIYQAAVYTITTERCRMVFSGVLRELIGAGNEYSVEAASDAIGIDARTLRSYLSGENLPNATALLRMCMLFGPSFTDAILSIAGYAGATRIHKLEGISEFTLNANTVGLLKEISDAIKDGRVDHIERARILKEAKRLHNTLDNFIAQNSRARG